MRPGYDIPLAFDVKDPSLLKRDLERQAVSLDSFARTAFKTFEAIPKPGAVARTGSTYAAFDIMTRVGPESGGGVFVYLPRPDARNAGRTCPIERVSASTGFVVLVPSGCLVNGLQRVNLLANAGITYVYFDGQGYYSDSCCVAWNAGMP